jgi:hypothetical protein
MVTMAAENASAMAPLRMTREGAGRARCFLAAARSGTARPITVASVISQTRYSATSQVQPSRCASAHRAAPELISSSLTVVKSGQSQLPGISPCNASGPPFPAVPASWRMGPTTPKSLLSDRHASANLLSELALGVRVTRPSAVQ